MSCPSGTQHVGIFSETGVHFNLYISPKLNTEGTEYVLVVIRLVVKVENLLQISKESAQFTD
jgi:hypothetical protein